MKDCLLFESVMRISTSIDLSSRLGVEVTKRICPPFILTGSLGNSPIFWSFRSSVSKCCGNTRTNETREWYKRPRGKINWWRNPYDRFFRQNQTHNRLFVYYESIKCELKIKPIYECRCDETLKTKGEEFTRLVYTVVVYYESNTLSTLNTN